MVFYVIKSESLGRVREFLTEKKDEPCSFGSFFEWLVTKVQHSGRVSCLGVLSVGLSRAVYALSCAMLACALFSLSPSSPICPLCGAAHSHPPSLVLPTKETVYGMKLPDHFSLIGAVGISEYRKVLKRRSVEPTAARGNPIVRRANARIGVMGNPSDGFNGKTISLSIANFWAEASIEASTRLVSEGEG